MASARKLTVLITGCSPGGMGAALAEVFHAAGHRVYATARNPAKLSPLASQGIETLTLDVTSTESIASAVSALTKSLSSSVGGGLDVLINNAGGHYTTAISDASIDSAKTLFDLNVWAQLAVTQAFLPLLLKSASSFPSSSSSSSSWFCCSSSGGGGPATPMIVNHTSVGSVSPVPFQSLYSASKAAFARLSDGMRLELAPFGIRIVELKTAMVQSNFIRNSNTNNVEGKEAVRDGRLPEGSLYEPARGIIEKAMSQEQFDGRGTTAERWAKEVVGDLLKRNPPPVVWRGDTAWVARLASLLPYGVFDGLLMRMLNLDAMGEIIRESRK